MNILGKTEAQEWVRISEKLLADSRSWSLGLGELRLGNRGVWDPQTKGHLKDDFEVWQDLVNAEFPFRQICEKGKDLLSLPLPQGPLKVWAYGMTYSEHKKETFQSRPLLFEKEVAPWLMGQADLPWIEYLDFEAEIGILMHRKDPKHFGFLLLNDFTDRGIQVLQFQAKNPTYSFSKAKCFSGALQVGPSIHFGTEEDWLGLEVELQVNGQIRQQLTTKNCLLSPSHMHTEVFKRSVGFDWVLVASGTSSGTCFRMPNTLEKIKLVLGSGLSLIRAKEYSIKEQWLKELTFLAPGDVIEMSSPQLGYTKVQVQLKNK